VYGEGDTELGGVLGLGTGTLNKFGGGTLTLSGAGANTFSGATAVNAGTLLLSKNAGVNAIPGAGAVNIYSGGVLKYGGNNNMVADTVAVNIYGTGQLDFNGASDTIGNVAVNATTGASGDSTNLVNTAGGGTLTIGTLTVTPVSGYMAELDTGTGTLKLGGNVAFALNGTGRVRTSGNLDLGAANRTFTIGDGAHPDFDMLIDANVSASGGAYGVVKAGAGKLVLSGTNTYTGINTLSAGILRAERNTNALGRSTAANALALAASTFLELGGNTGLNFGRNATVGGAMQIASDRVTPGAGVTHSLASMSIGAFVLTVAGGTNVNSGVAGLAFTNATLTGAATFTVNNPVNGGATMLTIDGPVAGAFASAKAGPGTLKLTGPGANTRSGLFTVSAGTLLLDKSGSLEAIANGGLTIGAASTNRAVALYTGDSTDMMGRGPIIINGQSRLDFNGKTDTVGPVTVASAGAGGDTTAITNTAGGGMLSIGLLTITPLAGYTATINSGTGTLRLTNNVTFAAATTGRAKLSGNLDLGIANRTFTIANGTHPDYDMLVDANISSASGAYGIIKATAASTLVLAGTNTYTGINTLSAGILRAERNASALGQSTAANALALAAGTFLELAGDTGLNFGRNATVSGAMQISSDRVTPGAGVTHGLGALSIGAFALTVTGGSNVNSGVAELTFTNATLTGNAAFTVNNPANGGVTRLTLNGPVGESGGARTLTKNGAGTLRMTGTNTCSGATTVSAGTLEVVGLFAKTSGTTVNGTGATLAGTGTVTNAVTVTSGKVTPGEAGSNPGVLTIKGNYNQANANGNLTVDVNGASAGAGYDQLVVSGTITLGGGLGTLTVNGTYTPVSGDQFTIVRKDSAGAVSGYFSGLDEGATVSVNGENCTITYVGGDGNDIVLVAPLTFKTWDGGSTVDSNWTTAENWIPDTPPGAGAALIFVGPGRFNNVNNFGAYTPFAQLSFTNTSGSFTLSGNAITLRGNILNYSSYPHRLNLGLRLTGYREVTAIDGSLMLGGRVEDDGTGWGVLINGAGLVTMTNDNAYTGSTVLQGGTLCVQGHTNALGLGTGPAALNLTGAGCELRLVGDAGLAFGRNTTVGAAMKITSERVTSGAGVTHRLGALSIGATTLTLAGGTNVNSGVAGLTFSNGTLTGNAVLAVTNPVAGGATWLTLDGALAGAFSLTKNGAGTLKLAGSDANTRSGLFTVNAGTVLLDKSGSAQAVANGGLTIGSASTNRALVMYTGGSSDMIGTGTLTVNGQGRFDFNGKTDIVSNVVVVATGAGGDSVAITNTAGGGTLTIGTLGITPLAGYLTTLGSGTGVIKLGGNVTFTAGGTGRAKVDGVLDLGAANRVFTVNDGTSVTDLLVNATITSTSGASLIKAGTGLMTLVATNTFGGSLTNTAGTLTLACSNSFGGSGRFVTQAGGTLNINHASALGDSANIFVVNGGTINNLNGSPMTLAHDYVLRWGGAFTFTGSQSLDLGNGPLTLTGNCLPTISASSLTVNGNIDGAFNFGKAGAGILNLWGTNTFGGAGRTFSMSAGTLNFDHPAVFGDAANTLVLTAGTFNNTTNGPTTLAYNYAQTWSGGFGFGGASSLHMGTGPVTLTANSTITVVTNTLTVAGPIGGAFYVAKAGNGVLELTATNNYSGFTYLNLGVLRADQGRGFPANSLLYFNYNGTAGPNCLETSGTFTRNIDSAAGPNVYWFYSGGFAARGGPLTVNLEGGITLNWTDGNTGFRGQYLLMGSRSATDVVTLENSIELRADRNIYVFDNAAVTTDYTRLTGVLANGDATARGLNKLGDGLLEITAKSTYSGYTRLYLGELRVNGTITNANHLCTVSYSTTASTLSGTGMVGQLTVNALGTVSPGNNGAGALRTAGNTIFNNNSTYNWDIGLLTNDTVHVTGNLTLNSTWTLRLRDVGGASAASDELAVFTYTGWMAAIPGTCQLDATQLDPALWDVSGLQLMHDPVLKRVYLKGLRYKGIVVSIGDAVVEEGDSGTTNATFVVSASAGTNATVNFSSVDGSAVSASDYAATNGLLIFTPAQTSRTVTVVVNGDVGDEWPSEQFYVNLLTPTNARFSRARGTGFIADDDGGMLYWMKITIPGYSKNSTLTNFPVAVKLNESLDGFSYDQFASLTGGDLRFVSSNRAVALNHEIEKWDRTGDSWVWVQVPRLSGTNTYFWAYWGDPARATAPAYTTNGATWSEDFVAVWHLNSTNAAGKFEDSTPNPYDGVNQGCLDAVGTVGGGQDLNGLRRVNITGVTYAPSIAADRVFSMQMWVKGGDTVADRLLVDVQTGRLGLLFNQPDGGKVGYNDNATYRGGLSGGLNDSAWHHLAYVFNGGATTCWVYVDGQLAGPLPYAGTYAINGNARIGSDYNGAGNHFEGLVDEVRICKGMRSADWIWAMYTNQLSGSAFVSMGDIAANATALQVAARPASDVGTRSVTMNGVLVYDGGTNARVYMCYGTADGGTSTAAWNKVVLLGTNFVSLDSIMYNATGLVPRTVYQYRCFATNSTGYSWSAPPRTFRTWGEWYVATNGNNTVGTNWTTAFTTLQAALDATPKTSNEIFMAGHRYVLGTQAVWTNSYVRIRGGYQGAGLPGSNNPALWTSLLTRNSAATTNRLLFIRNVAHGTIYGVTLTNGYARGASHPAASGAGVSVTNCPGVTFDTCRIVRNNCWLTTVNGGNIYGGGICSENSTIVVTNCVVSSNKTITVSTSNLQHGNGGGIASINGTITVRNSLLEKNLVDGDYLHGINRGGGLHIGGTAGGQNEVTDTVIINNDSDPSNNYSPSRGDGIYVGTPAGAGAFSGSVVFRNCLIARNTGVGVWLEGGSTLFENCTLAQNASYGIYRNAGSANVRSSILWQNGDDVFQNVVGNVNFYYCTIEDGDNYMVDGCTDVDPVFSDTNTYHLASMYGHYTNGYFGGGSWVTAGVNSAVIDLGDPAAAFPKEPHPNGGRLNMGVYGNTATASKSHPLQVSNLAPSGISPTNATLNGRLDYIGSPDVKVWLYWGPRDGTNNPSAWSNSVYMGLFNAPTSFSTRAEGLTVNSNYYYRVYATNSGAAVAWAQPSTSFTASASAPVVVNRGVLNDGTALVTLQGEVTSAGGNNPKVYVCWGLEDAGLSTALWDHVEYVGIHSGTFATNVVAVAGESYYYRCYATNIVGDGWSDPATDFGAYRMLYVATNAAGLGTGESWDNAFTSIDAALAGCSLTRTNRIHLKGGTGGTFEVFSQVTVNKSKVMLLGGYEGTGWPGAHNAQTWPTVLKRYPANSIRLLSIQNATNVTVKDITITSGFVDGNGAGIEILSSTNVFLGRCVISNNTVSAATLNSYGGGIYAFTSYGVISNCWIGRNRMQAIVASYALYGSGIYLAGGGWSILDSVLFYNTSRSAGTGGNCFGGGIGAGSGDHFVRNCLVVQNYCFGVADSVVNSRGDGVYHSGGTLTMENCTIAGNKGEGVRGIAGTTLRDCNLWRNERDVTNSAVVVTDHCNIGNGERAGINGNIAADPRFELGFYLSAGSDCIDAGSRTVAAAGLAGKTTLTNGTADAGTVDLGYHYSGVHPLPDLYVAVSGANTNSGTSWAAAYSTLTRALSRADLGTRIHIGEGTYSTNSGEVFPLRIDVAGVSLAGTNRSATVLMAPGSPVQGRVVEIWNGSFCRVAGVTIRNGYLRRDSIPVLGAGILFTNATDGIIADTVVATNLLWGDANSTLRGAGVALTNSSVVMQDCLIQGNRSIFNAGPWAGNSGGGGIFVNGNRVAISRTVVRNNNAYANAYDTARGGGIFIESGAHSLTNCLVVRNSSYAYSINGVDPQGDGIYAKGTVKIENCTVADNGASNTVSPIGIWGQGAITVTNCILWNNGDDLSENVVGSIRLFYSCIEDGDNEGVQGCVRDNPAFSDTVYYHLRSQYGHYTNGYFSGGGWVNDATTNSYLIDRCRPDVVPVAEPSPNGAVVNMGTYGNTYVASKSPPLTVTNRPPNGVATNAATLNGRLVCMGDPGVHVWFYYGTTDGTNNKGAWATNVYVGEMAAAGNFSKRVYNLASNITYYYRSFASNSAGVVAWGEPSVTFVAEQMPPEIETRGILNEAGPVATLKGEVTSTGGDDTRVYVCWGVGNGGSATSGWEHVIDMGIQESLFQTNVTIDVRSNYWYNCYATNRFGNGWGTPMSFGRFRVRYVKKSATGLNTGQNWTDAFTDLQAAIDGSAVDRTNILYIAGTYTVPAEIVWTNSMVWLKGGFQGMSGYPGAYDPRLYPTVISNIAASIRVMMLNRVTNCVIQDVIVSGGKGNVDGGGLYIVRCTNLTLSGVAVSYNSANDVATYSCGGGLFASNSYGVLTNCWVRENTTRSVQANRYCLGGGMYVRDGEWRFRDTVFYDNRSESLGGSGRAFGSGLYLQNGTHALKNCLFVQNYSVAANDATNFARGDGVEAAGTAVVSVDSCTVAGNKGEGIRGTTSTTISNSILWANFDDVVGVPAGNIRYSNVEDGDNLGVNGCLASDPVFEYGFYLTSTSPCLNVAGTSATAAGLSTYMTRANGSLDGGVLDMGYHYRTVPSPATRDLYVSTTGSDSNSGTNWAQAFRSITHAIAAADIGTHIHVGAGTYVTNVAESLPLELREAGVWLIGGPLRNDVVISAPPGTPARCLNVIDASFAKVSGITFRDHYRLNSSFWEDIQGGGVYASNATAFTVQGCLIAGNRIDGNVNDYLDGAGFYMTRSSVRMIDTHVSSNRLYVTAGGWNGHGWGAGIYVASGELYARNLVVCDNVTSNNNYQNAMGGGIYFAAGSHFLENCLVFSNNCVGTDPERLGDGMYVDGAVTFVNSTVVDNGARNPGVGYGIYVGSGSLRMTNCIVWNHDDDLYNAGTNLSYSVIEDGDNNGTNHCNSVNPEFADRTYYHLKSKVGYYQGGYFDGGTWTTNEISSPCIDAGWPGGSFEREPSPHGNRVNIGGYANSPTASKSGTIPLKGSMYLLY